MALPTVGAAFGVVTTNESVLLAPEGSAAVTVIVQLPTADGVPLNLRVLDVNDIHAGMPVAL
jgi:hypothetical protein